MPTIFLHRLWWAVPTLQDFAQQFGGGGHARASGAKLEGSLQQAHDRVVGEAVQRFAHE